MNVGFDEWVGYSRAARDENRASKPDRVKRRLHCALLRAYDGRRISMDRITLGSSGRARIVLHAIAKRRHRKDTSAFIGWYAFPVLGIRTMQPFTVSVIPAPLRANPFHSELLFSHDMRFNETNRKMVIDDLMELGCWRGAE